MPLRAFPIFSPRGLGIAPSSQAEELSHRSRQAPRAVPEAVILAIGTLGREQSRLICRPAPPQSIRSLSPADVPVQFILGHVEARSQRGPTMSPLRRARPPWRGGAVLEQGRGHQAADGGVEGRG